MPRPKPRNLTAAEERTARDRLHPLTNEQRLRRIQAAEARLSRGWSARDAAIVKAQSEFVFQKMGTD